MSEDPLRILFISDNFPPEVNAPASRTFEHCKEWVQAGHEVIVVTCAPNFPAGKVFEGYTNKWYSVEVVEGIKVIRVWSYIVPNAGFVLRTIDFLSFMVTSIVAGLTVRKVDVIVGTSPQFFVACSSAVLGFLKRKPWVFELRDLWPESITAVEVLPFRWPVYVLEKLELLLYRRAALIVSVTHSFKRNLVARGIPEKKISVITNGVDLTRFRAREEELELRTRLGLEGRFIVGYVGTHGMAHALDTILDSAAILLGSPIGGDVHFVFLGEGSEKARLQQRRNSERLSNVTFLEPVSKEEVVKYWGLLDVSVVHLKDVPLFETVIPSKLFECMAMGVPIVHGVRGESADIVVQHEVGITFEPENAEELCAAILRLKQDTVVLERMGKKGIASARVYDRKHLAKKMVSEFQSLLTSE